MRPFPIPVRRTRARWARAARGVLVRAWAAPVTAVGLLAGVAALAAGGRWRRVDGIVEIDGGAIGRWLAGRPRLGRFSAITLGHVVLGHAPQTLQALRLHEQVHVRQYERWGPLFVPAYFASSAWQWLRGRDPYLDNAFEREAFEAERAAGLRA